MTKRLRRMKSLDFIAERRQAIKESVDFFSSKKKGLREAWVATEFLMRLGLTVGTDEVTPLVNDPPDVLFREARFEIKEIQRPGRRRHAEYKEALAKARAATSPQDLFEPFEPKDISPSEAGDLILAELERLKDAYDPQFSRGLDLLFYVNYDEYFLREGPVPGSEPFSHFQWRSIAALVQSAAIVLFAQPNAPEFLRSRVGRLQSRRSRQKAPSNQGFRRLPEGAG